MFLLLIIRLVSTNYEHLISTKATVKEKADRKFSLICPKDYVLISCTYTGKLVELNRDGKICTATGKDFSLTIDCAPIALYKTEIISKFTTQDTDSITCPSGYSLSNCGEILDFNKFKISASSPKCTISQNKKSDYNEGIYQAICTKTVFKKFTNTVFKDGNGVYTASYVCPKGSMIYSCTCADLMMCGSSEIYRNKCIVKYAGNSKFVDGYTICSESPDVIRTKNPQDDHSVASCSIKIGPNSDESYMKIRNRLSSDCKLNPPCKDCQIKPILFTSKVMVIVAPKNTPATCPKNRILTNCQALHSSSRVEKNKCYANEAQVGRDPTYAVATCIRKPCYSDIIYKRYTPHNNKKYGRYGAQCDKGEKLISCMIEGVKSPTSTFYKQSDINKCTIDGTSLNIIEVCRKDNPKPKSNKLAPTLNLSSQVVYHAKSGISNKVTVTCPKDYSFTRCNPVYSGYSYVDGDTCYAYPSNDNAFSQVEGTCVKNSPTKTTPNPKKAVDQYFSSITEVRGGKGQVSENSCPPGFKVISCECSDNSNCYGTRVVDGGTTCFSESDSRDNQVVIRCGKVKDSTRDMKYETETMPYQKAENSLYRENKTIVTCLYSSECKTSKNTNQVFLRNNRCEFEHEPTLIGTLSYGFLN